MINASMDNQICFEKYTLAMEQLKSNSIELDHADLENILRKKRNTNNEGIKSICWYVPNYKKTNNVKIYVLIL